VWVGILKLIDSFIRITINKYIMHIRIIFCGIVAIALSMNIANAQTAINTDGTSPDNSAMLDVKSTTMGFLPPRLSTAQRNSIPSPATGLILYNTTTNRYNFFNGTVWNEVAATKISGISTGSNSPGGGISIYAYTPTPPNGSAMLDMNDPSRGMLIPRIDPGGISSPAAGLLIYNTSNGRIAFHNGSQWTSACGQSTGISGASGSQLSIGLSFNIIYAPPDPSAIMDVGSSSRGILIPRMTTAQRNIMLAVQGLTIYNTVTGEIQFYTGTGWYRLEINSPSTPTPITGSTAVCPGIAGTAYSVSQDSSVVTYNWTVPTGWTNLSGQGTNAITVTTGSAGQNGNISVTAQNYCGTSSPGQLAVVVNASPAISGQPVSVHTCELTGAPSFMVTATGTALTYQWQEYISSWNNIPNGGVYSGATTATLVITNPPSSMNNRQYHCVVSGACTPAATSNAATLTVYSNTITVNVTPKSPAICPADTINLHGHPTGGTLPYTSLWTGSGSSYLNHSDTTDPVFSSNGVCGNKKLVYQASDSHGCSKKDSTIITIADNIPPSVTCPADRTVNHDVGNCSGATVFAPVLSISTLPLASQSSVIGADPFQDNRWQSFTANKTGFVTQIRFWDTLATTNSNPIWYRGGNSNIPVTVNYTLNLYSGEYVWNTPYDHSAYKFECIYGALLYTVTGTANGHLVTIDIPQNQTPYVETGKTYTVYIGGQLWPILYGSNDVSWNTTYGKYWDDANILPNGSSGPNGCPGTVFCNWDGFNSWTKNYKMKYEIYISENQFGLSATDNCSIKTLTIDPPASHLYPSPSTTAVTFTATDFGGNSSSCSFNLTVNPIQQPIISGPNSVTAPSPGNVYSTETGKTNYTWNVSSGGTITAGGGTGNNTVTVTWNTAGAQTVSVNYTNGDGCRPASPTVFPVTVN